MTISLEDRLLSLVEKHASYARYLGIMEGFMDGRTEGRMEGKHEVARQLLNMGSDISFVAKATKISIEELKLIRATNEVGD